MHRDKFYAFLLSALQNQCYLIPVSFRLTPSHSFYSLCDYSVAQVSGKSPSRRPAQSLSKYSENSWSRTHLHVLMSAFMKTAQFLSISVSQLRHSISVALLSSGFQIKTSKPSNIHTRFFPSQFS
jgi:hypothetical protein